MGPQNTLCLSSLVTMTTYTVLWDRSHSECYLPINSFILLISACILGTGRDRKSTLTTIKIYPRFTVCTKPGSEGHVLHTALSSGYTVIN
jgi:hypothetical protein